MNHQSALMELKREMRRSIFGVLLYVHESSLGEELSEVRRPCRFESRVLDKQKLKEILEVVRLACWR